MFKNMVWELKKLNKKTLKVVTFRDPVDGDVKWDAVFFSELSEAELQEKVEEIIKWFESTDNYDWDYEDLVDELFKRKLAEKVDCGVDWCEIIA